MQIAIPPSFQQSLIIENNRYAVRDSPGIHKPTNPFNDAEGRIYTKNEYKDI